MSLEEVLDKFRKEPPKIYIHNKDHKEMCDLLKTLIVGIEDMCVRLETLEKIRAPKVMRPDRMSKIS